MAKTLYELYLDNMKKAGTQKASQPAALPAIKMPTLEAPKTTPAAGSATGVKMPTVGAKKPSGVDIVKAVTQKPAAQGGGRATMPQVKKQETATDRLANIRAFGAGDYSGGGELLEKAYKTARAAVKGIGSSYANIGGSIVEGMGNLQETMQKGEYDKKVQQMKDNKAFYEQALKTGVNPRTGKKLTVDEKSRYYKILNTHYTDGKIAQMENVYKDATASQKARTMEAANDAFAASDRLKASADKDVAAAKEGSGKVGQFLVDLGYTGTQLLADTAANAIAPGAGMVSMASRVYGDASAEARREGKTAGQQALSGLKGATIEVLTEKLFGGLAKAYGAGTADELVKKVADKLTKTEAGQRAAVWLINSGGEGLEEVVSDVLNPLADRALGLDDGTGAIFTADDAAQMAYDFLLGTAMGTIGGAGQLWDTKSSAPAAQETRPVQMPTLVDANGRTAAQRQAEKPENISRLNNENGLAAYTPQERVNLSSGGRNKIVSTYQEALAFVKKALTNKKNVDRAYMGIVPNDVAGRILTESGVDISGYGVMMNGDDVRHILKGHGDSTAEAARGQVAVTESAIAQIPEVIAQPDNVYLSAESDGKGRQAIVFEKQIGDTYITIQGVANGKRLLQTDTLYIRKRRTRKPQDTMPGASESTVPVINVRNELPQSPSFTDTTIPRELEGVNTQGMQLGREYVPVQMPAVGNAPVTTRDGNIFQPGNSDSVPAGNMSWHDVYGISERSEPVDTGSESLTTEDSAELNDYLDALAQDENAFTDDPYTVSDAVYDAKLRRLAGEEAPPETRTQEQVTQADLDELASLFADIADPIDADKNAMTADMVSNESVPQKQSKREAVRSAWDFFYRKMVDAGHSVTKLSEAVSDPYLYQFYNQARASSSAGVNMITDAQTNARGQKVGASLNDVFSPIRAKGDGYYHDFQLYMYDLHNIDRMSLSRNKEARVMEARAALRDFDANNPDIRTDTAAQLHRMTEDPDPDMAALAREKERLIRELDRAEAIKDKPVFDYEFTAGDSRARAERLLRQNPEFTEYQAQVRKYIDNMMQYRVESGLITQEDADFLKTFYPNYVPTMRVQEKGTAGAGRDLNAVRVGKTVGRAQGGTERLLPLHEALGKQTMQVVREGSKNRFADRLLHDYIQAGDTVQVNRYIKEASRYEHDFNPDSLDDVSVERPTKDKTVTAYVNGTLWEMTVDDTLFDAVKALSPDTTESNAVTKVIRASNNLFKSLVTGYNPTFLARNVIRDLQTAGLNTRDAAAFARNYPRALAEIRNNGEYWQLYKALGGVYSSVFDYTTGTVKEPKGAMGKFMARVEALNMAAEQAPRLAEFMGVMQNAERASARGEAVNDLATAADALYAAADITVNFGRAGSLGKVLNANYVPFLNPGVQGLDKLIRRITETRGAKEWAKLVVRAAALGIAPSLLNALLYNDDDEWEDLRDSDKDTNYMFKLGNGYWLKIPKGRELSVFGIAADRVYDALRGEDVDVLSTVNTVGSQVAPANPLTSNIFSALVDSQLLDPDSPGRTWYSGDIESQRLQNYAPGERYDSGTDIFSKTVGQALGISPKKLNYVLDQYSGVVGDFLLPILTPQAERNMFAKAFTVDSMSSNRVSSDFYDEADELKYAKNGGDTAAGIVGRWWSKQQAACSDLWKQIREAEESTELSNKEKRQQTRELKAVVTGIQKNAMAVEETYREAVEKHLSSGADEDTAYRDANKDCFGAEYALQVYNKDVYQRAQDAKQNGVSYDDFYTYYFGTKDLKATTTESAVSRRFQFLRASGMSEHTQAEIYFADMASDKTLTSLADLEINAGISAEDYYLYKASSAGMTKKAEKLSAIDSLNLTAAQKDALYYSEGWAESKLHEAPWHGGQTAAVRMPVVKTTGGAPVFVRVTQSVPTVQMPVVRTTAKAPVFARVTQNAPKAVRVVKMPVVK
jgi:hypothetical protein